MMQAPVDTMIVLPYFKDRTWDSQPTISMFLFSLRFFFFFQLSETFPFPLEGMALRKVFLIRNSIMLGKGLQDGWWLEKKLGRQWASYSFLWTDLVPHQTIFLIHFSCVVMDKSLNPKQMFSKLINIWW